MTRSLQSLALVPQALPSEPRDARRRCMRRRHDSNAKSRGRQDRAVHEAADGKAVEICRGRLDGLELCCAWMRVSGTPGASAGTCRELSSATTGLSRDSSMTDARTRGIEPVNSSLHAKRQAIEHGDPALVAQARARLAHSWPSRLKWPVSLPLLSSG